MRKITPLLCVASALYLGLAELPVNKHQIRWQSHAAIASDAFDRALEATEAADRTAGVKSQIETINGVRIITWNAPAIGNNVQVVCLPGLGLCAQGYAPLAKELLSMGISTHVIDA